MAASSTTELIKEKLDIVQFLRGYLNLQPAGKNFKALCPFHREKTPSFMVSPERQSWHCFGCGLGGDIFGFLMRYENIDFGEALRALAERAGVELRRLNPAEYKLTGLLHEINNAAAAFFKRNLEGFAPAKKYLADRRLEPATIEEFDVGWSLNQSEALSMHLLNSGYSPDDVIRAGLALRSDRGLLFDRFRGRIMFPIHDHFGKIAGFTGRILPQYDTGEMGKYVNSPESPIFNKSKLLYGLWKSKNFVREAKSAFLVEGQIDFLMSWQSGVKNVVASSGTALTADHLKTLKRLTDELYLSFDADAAGSAAAERAIDLAEAGDMGVKVVVFKDFKDPAEAAEAGPENLKLAIASAIEAPAFYFQKYLTGLRGPDFGRREGLKQLRAVLAKLKGISSPVTRSFWLKELSKKTGLDERILIEEAEKLAPEKLVSEEIEENKIPQPVYSRKEKIGERLLSVALARNDFGILDDCATYLAPLSRQALAILKGGGKSSADPSLDEFLNLIVLGSSIFGAEKVSILKDELLKEYLKERRLELTLTVKRAEAAGDEAGVNGALEELKNLTLNVLRS